MEFKEFKLQEGDRFGCVPVTLYFLAYLVQRSIRYMADNVGVTWCYLVWFGEVW
jgi:hypothetical protein